MTSAIDPTKPATGQATTLSVRQNFAAAKSELEAFGTPGTTTGDALIATKLDAPGSVARTQHGKNAESVSAADFSGYDSTGVADSYAALAAAVAAVPIGQKLLIQGTPRIATKLTINRNIQLVFEGGRGRSSSDLPGSYIIKSAAMTTAAIEFTASGASMERGGVVCQPGNTGDAIVLLANGLRLDDVYAKGAGQDNFRIGSDLPGFNANSFLLDNTVSIAPGRHCYYINDDNTGASTDANGGEIRSPFMTQGGGDGIKNDRGWGNTVVAPLAETNVVIGIHVASNSRSFVVLGGDAAEANGVDIQIDSGAADTSLVFVPYTTLTDNGTRTSILSQSIFQFPVQVKGTTNSGGLGAAFIARAATAAYAWYATGGGVDQKGWDINTTGLTLLFRCINDANSVANPFLTITRTAAAPISAAWSTRNEEAQGAVVASTGSLALGTDGNYFQISGNTQINLLTFAGWQGGSTVTLKFNSTPTVKHNQVVSGNFKPILLAGGVDFVATANDTLTLRYDATDAVWYEQARAVI